MKQIFYTFTKSLLAKLALVAALFVGGGNFAWADTVIFGGSVASGWTYTKSDGSSLSVTSSILSNYDASDARLYTSTSSISISSGQTIVLQAKLYGTTSTLKPSSSVKVKYSADNGTTWTTANNYTYSNGDLGSDYATFVVDNIVDGSYKIQFEFLYSSINSIILKDAPTTPVLSITPNEDASFGTVTAVATKTYTVSNTGVGKMTVNINSSNPADFSVSPSTLTDIEKGTPQTFTVTFNYKESNTGSFSSIITVTPTFEGGAPVELSATALVGYDLLLDENQTTTISKISSKKVLLKYTPKNSWNTACFPFAWNNYKNAIFGFECMVYSFSKYENNTITFETASYPSAGTPYLVYSKNTPDQSSFELSSVSIYGENPSPSKTVQNDATFQGTYAPMNMEGKFGVTSDGRVMEGTSSANLKGYRAYFTGISAPSSGDARISLVFVDDQEGLGVSAAKWLEGNADAYNLQGQKVEKGRKGIYIVNGKKVIIK